jgi:hypothetical protein
MQQGVVSFFVVFFFVGVVSKVGQCAVVGTTYETRSSFVFPFFFSFVGVVSKVGQCAVVGATYETRSSFVFPFFFIRRSCFESWAVCGGRNHI